MMCLPPWVRPQERAQRRTVQQIVDPVPLPTLDDPAPQMVGQLLNLAHFLDTPLPDPEQVIEFPKILSDDVPMRTPVREPQLAEQLVEVPTIVSWSLLQLITKQNVDIPVPGRGGRISGLQGFLPGQSSSASSSSPAGVHGSADGPGEGVFFRTFPRKKKCEDRSALGVGTECGLYFSTQAAHADSSAVVELLDNFKQLSGQVGEMDRRSELVRQGFSSDIDVLYRLITEARHRLQQLEAWGDEVAGDDDVPG